MDSCFCHHYKRHFIFFISTWYCVKMRRSLFTSFFIGSLVLAICSNTSKLQSSSTPMLTKTLSDSAKGCKWWWHFNNMGYKDLLSQFSTIPTACSLPINENTRQRLLNLDLTSKKTYYGLSFLQFFQERKEKFQHNTNFLSNVKCKEVNSTTTIDSSSIKFCRG